MILWIYDSMSLAENHDLNRRKNTYKYFSEAHRKKKRV